MQLSAMSTQKAQSHFLYAVITAASSTVSVIARTVQNWQAFFTVPPVQQSTARQKSCWSLWVFWARYRASFPGSVEDLEAEPVSWLATEAVSWLKPPPLTSSSEWVSFPTQVGC